jgi:hypothetical protein
MIKYLQITLIVIGFISVTLHFVHTIHDPSSFLQSPLLTNMVRSIKMRIPSPPPPPPFALDNRQQALWRAKFAIVDFKTDYSSISCVTFGIFFCEPVEFPYRPIFPFLGDL